MRDFMRTVRFKILAAILMVMLGFMIAAVYSGGTTPLISQVVSFITVPLQQLSSNLSGSAGEFFDQFINAGKVYEQNAELQQEINDLRRRLVDYDKYKHENEQFRKIIGVTEERQDLSVITASVISRDVSNPFYAFTIDKGSLDAVKLYDPVMTEDGLVGYITEVGLHSAKAMTLLDVSINVGAKVSATRDTGIVTGTVELAQEGLCKMEYLPRESEVAVGDLVITSGGNLFPKDVVIGEIIEIQTSSGGNSLEAIIRPATEIQSVKDVVVITEFEGQGAD